MRPQLHVGAVTERRNVGQERPGKGQPFDNLHERKRTQVRRRAGVWLHEVPERPRFFAIRCDAVGVLLDDRGDLVRLDHLQAAF